MRNFDAIVIGSGQAGPSLTARLTGAGMSVAFIERAHFGGTCVNDGCIPTKTLVASAQAARMARRAGEYGVRITGSIDVDMKAVKARKDAISESSRSGVEKWLRGMQGCTVFWGNARFAGTKQVAVNGEELSAEKIFINVGGRPSVPPIPGLDQVPYLTNTTMMGVDFLPEHLVILGGSYIGLEFAQMYRRFGSAVSVIEALPRLVAREDEDISAEIAKILEQEGIAIKLGAKALSVARKGNGIAVEIETSNGRAQVEGSHLLVAIGRRPNTDNFGLDKAGIKLDARGYIEVDDQLRTSAPGVWALGDCNGRGAFTHTSYNDYEIVAANLLDNDPRRVSDRITAYALYIDPPLGRAGLSQAEARATKRPTLVANWQMGRVGRAVERGETEGFMRILIDRDSRQIVGASLLGLNADEVIHEILDLMYAKAPYTTLQRAMHIHPTVSEYLPTMLGALTPLE
ncbi:MAG: FAD-containing oxidoreductase [Xanthobacteraceae bacterium]|nr:FAD-containing oxidoreductase [Xanthobacteraceae bacterium]